MQTLKWISRLTGMSNAAIVPAMVLGAVMFGGRAVQGQSLQNVTYVGGTALQGNGLHGKLAINSTDSLVFEGETKLAISYDHVISYESRSHRKVHIGLLPEGLWRLLAPWPEEKQLSLSYHDADDHSQVVVLQMSRADEAMLVEVLKTRVPRSMMRQPALGSRPAVIAQEKPAVH